MAPRPKAEQHPQGLSAEWTHTWEHALKVLKEQGTWAWEQKPLLDEYVFALKAAADARAGFAWLDALEEYAENADDLPEIAWSVLRQIAGSLPSQWDRHTRRAVLLAETLKLTPEQQRKLGGKEPDGHSDPFSEFDELAAARARRDST